MRLEFHFLDYLWKSLLIGGAAATVVYALVILVHILFRGRSARQAKWFGNIQLMSLAGLTVAGFALVPLVDPDLMAGCFNSFVKSGTSYTVTRQLACFWLVTASALMIFELACHAVALRKRFRFVSEAAAIDIFEEIKVAMGVNRPVKLRLTENGSPFVHGLNSVVIPRNLLEPANRQTLRDALAHELAHVRDADVVFGVLELFLRRIFFFHPLAYAAAKAYGAQVERAADETAVRRARLNPGEYIRSLIQIAEFSSLGPAPALTMNASRGYQETRRRIELVANLHEKENNRAAWLLLPILSALSVSLSVAEAKSAIGVHTETGEPVMCVQVVHEKMLESWLRIESRSEPRTCEQ